MADERNRSWLGLAIGVAICTIAYAGFYFVFGRVYHDAESKITVRFFKNGMVGKLFIPAAWIEAKIIDDCVMLIDERGGTCFYTGYTMAGPGVYIKDR